MVVYANSYFVAALHILFTVHSMMFILYLYFLNIYQKANHTINFPDSQT